MSLNKIEITEKLKEVMYPYCEHCEETMETIKKLMERLTHG
jgi:hypothetical protein